MIVARNLTKSFGKLTAVDSINFVIPRGRVVGFLGPNGAGKTTTIRMIAGYLPPSAGSVEVDGIDVGKSRLEAQRRIGYMPETTPLYQEMRVAAYLHLRARLYGLSRTPRRNAVEDVLRRCALWDVRRRTIGQLSKGYRQRVGLAAAMVHQPPVLILDEPTAGLDPTQIREVRGLVRELAGRHTILLSTHILPEAELVCDDLVVMVGGRVLAQGSVEKLRGTLARGCRYVVETDMAAAERFLRELPSIGDVEASMLGDGWSRLVVTPAPDADDRRELISRTLRKQGAAVRELKRESLSLEQMFVRLISGEPIEPPDADDAARPVALAGGAGAGAVGAGKEGALP